MPSDFILHNINGVPFCSDIRRIGMHLLDVFIA
jgi:hypothetical protein